MCSFLYLKTYCLDVVKLEFLNWEDIEYGASEFT